jgi:coenzyme F420-reducing hydrogenase delta subunit
MECWWWDAIQATAHTRRATWALNEGYALRESWLLNLDLIAAEGDKFAAEVNKFADEIRKIGPNPIRL